MRATVLTEVVDKKSGKVLKRVAQPSRSFTEGLMHCLYLACQQGSLTEPRAVGYMGGVQIQGTGAEELYQNTSVYGFRVTQGHAGRRNWGQYPPNWGAVSLYDAWAVPMGIIFGEGNTPVSSYDRSLDLPAGISLPAPVSKPRFDTLMESATYGCFDAATDQWYFINHGTNPNKIYCFDINGVWQSTVNTDRTDVTVGYYSAFVHAGSLYVYRSSPRRLYQINLATGVTALERDIGGELGGTGVASSMWYDSVAGNIVCIGFVSGAEVRLGRWNLADFTLAAAVATIDFNRRATKTAATLARLTPVHGTFDWAFGSTDSNHWGLLDVVNLIWYPWVGADSTLPNIFASGIDSKGWHHSAHSGTAAVLMKQCKVRADTRNLRLLPTYCNLVEADAVSGYFDIVGSMENNTAAAIDIAEVGIHAFSGPANSPLIARDVLAVPVSVPAGQVIRTTYRLSASI